METSRRIFVTEADMNRLEAILEGHQWPAIQLLHEELSGATLVKSEDIPPDVVTMNSRVKFLDMESGEEMETTLVYPDSSDITQKRISITALVGAALFGLSVGDEIEWPVPSGTRRLKITAVLFQPEAAGRYDL